MNCHRAIAAGLLCVGAACTATLARADTPSDEDLAAGRALVAQLSPTAAPDPGADAALLAGVGEARATALLLAVDAYGKSNAATSGDWAAMHRALQGLVDLATAHDELLKASIFASLDEAAYRQQDQDYVAALAAARRGLELQQRSGEVATLYLPWRSIAEDLLQLGRIDEAAAAFAEARRVVQDPTGRFAGDLWGEIIALDASLGRHQLAHAESAAFLRAAGPETPPEFRAYSLLAAANLAIDEGHYDLGIDRVHASLAAIKTAADPSLFAFQAIDSLLALGMQAMQSLPYDTALGVCERLDTEFHGLPISIAGFAREIAKHRRRLSGRFDIVLREDSEAVKSARAANDPAGEIAALLATAVDYSYLHATALQLAALEQATDILRSPAGLTAAPALRYRTLNSLAATRFASGDQRGARDAYVEVTSGIEAITAATLRAQLADAYATAELGLAAVLERDGDVEAARSRLQQFTRPEGDAIGHFAQSQVLLQWARLERTAAERPDETIRLELAAIEALRQEKDAGGAVAARLQLVEFLATRGDSATAANGLSLARSQLELARTAARSLQLADAAWRLHYVDGLLAEAVGDRPAARLAYAAASEALDHIRAGLSDEEERRSFVDGAAVQDLYRRQVRLLLDAGRQADAWNVLERHKARSFLEILHGRRFADAPADASPPRARRATDALTTLEQEILATRSLLTPEGEAILGKSGRPPQALRAKLAVLEARFALARERIDSNNSRASQVLALRPASLHQTVARLPRGTTLIEYAVLERELAAFVVTRAGVHVVRWPVDTAALPKMVKQLRARLANPQPSDDVDDKLREAAATLIAPVLPAIPGGTRQLIIVPAEPLASVPFAALPLAPRRSEPERPLLERFAIAYLPSASTLQFLQFRAGEHASDVFLGALGDVSVDGLPGLPATLEETAAIQDLYPRAQRRVGAEFTHDAALQALAQHAVVHFATHGLVDAQAPLFSSLVTAPAEGRASRLSLYEVVDLRIKSRLVILSACETDLGQARGGDEIIGLTRTFLQAGADSVVSSLWQVDDTATALLMATLHMNLRAGESAPVALRHAQLATRRRFPQPFYWAPFTANGLR